MTTIRPSHLGMCVTDLERSLRFYCEGLGFEAAERYDLDGATAPGLDKALEVDGPVEMTSQFVRLDGMAIELLHYHSPRPTGVASRTRGQVGLTHLSFYVDDLDAATERLVRCGGTVVEGTRTAPGIELIFLADPDGVRVELMQADATP